jgi:putative endonuclease
MAKHLDTGKKGEEIAAQFLRESGLEVLAINWRHGRAEVDIIARDGKVLVFVEVKTRSYDFFGKPEEFVNKTKTRLMANAAAAYMKANGHDWAIRFDIVSILMKNENEWSVQHFKDAFFPGLEV